ncbi:MAG: M60 family metallopeptidase [Bacteroidaceae bacterium]|nr:M60 family metallopeptidase [Bacteroidaceae bacterium]
MKLKKLLTTVLVMCFMIALQAQPEAGKVYRFINKADANVTLGAASHTEAFGLAKKDGDFSQLWLLETHPNNAAAWSLRNLGNGLYLRATGTSTVWTFNAEPSSSTALYYIETSGGFCTFEPNNNSGSGNCMHYATSQGGAVVGWNTGAEATHWSMEEIAVSEEEMQANWAELDAFNGLLTNSYLEACQAALNNLFEDALCTKLKKDFADEAAIEADEDYLALPETLQKMVKKVYTDNWEEANYDSSKPSWESAQAKKFRIQSIEPYSIAGEITSWLGINAHSNMDNPTGLFGNARQHIFIMVEGEIKNGAELWLNPLAGHGLVSNYNNGTELHEGLNIVPFSGDGNAMYISYVVHTYSNGRFPYKLSDFDDLKVHIEGGNINGYYNAVGDHLWGEPDDDNDWLYYEERANLQNVTILGKRQILQFRFEDLVSYQENDDNGIAHTYYVNGMSYYLPENIQVPAGTPENQKINTMIEAWDRIHISEDITMGLLNKAAVDSLNALYPRYDENWEKAGNIYDIDEEFYAFQGGRDYSEYYNHHGVAYGTFSGYMSGGWKNCNYHHNTMGSIIGAIATDAGSAWGPGHEIGHQHQTAMNLNGLTEVTNNLFSNVAVWYMGIGTSRINGTEGNLAHVYDTFTKGDFFDNNIWALTHMYYRLWLYYHRCGKNTKFFPRLYELLRKEPMTRTYYCEGNNTILRFYKHACVAAGEDLTEFFRAHGFFVPMSSRLVGDYSNSEYTQTQADIDAAIAWVKNLGYKENLAPIFINDCTTEPTYSHDGKTQRAYWDGETTRGENAELGMYTHCIDELVQAEGYYYSRNGFDVKFQKKDNANGAIGFIIYSGDELLAFTNNYNLTLTKEAASKTLKIYAVQADGTKVELPSAAEAGTESEQLAALNTQLNTVKQYLSYVAESNSNTGLYFEQDLADLNELYTEALAAKNNQDQSVKTYGQWAHALEEAVLILTNDRFAYINIKESNFYSLQNQNRKDYFLTLENNTLYARSGEVTADTESKLWQLIPTGTAGEYYIKNIAGNYITNMPEGSAGVTISSDVNDALVFSVSRLVTGAYDITIKENGVALNFNYSTGQVIGGASGVSASRWRLYAVIENAFEQEKEYLPTLIAKANTMLDNVCVEGSTAGNITLKEGIIAIGTGLTDVIAKLMNNIAVAEADYETAYDYYRHICNIEEGLTELANKYIMLPKTSTEETKYWYHIRNAETGLYCAMDLETKSGLNKRAMTMEELTGRESEKELMWCFFATSDTTYTIMNAAEEQFVYSTTRSNLKADGAKDGESFVILPATGGFTINSAYGYWANTGSEYVKTSITPGHWFIEEVYTSDDETGIEEVIGEAAKAEDGVYDIYGRRISEITKPGIYIINGRKVLVK